MITVLYSFNHSKKVNDAPTVTVSYQNLQWITDMTGFIQFMKENPRCVFIEKCSHHSSQHKRFHRVLEQMLK